MFHKGMCWIMSFHMFFLYAYPTYTHAATQLQSPTKQQLVYQKTLQRLNETMDLVEQMREQLDRSQFNLEELLDSLDYNTENIVKFVTTEIKFQQYPGLLRGSHGTLLSRSGNSLDQALLLVTLLKDSGLDAQILRGRLSPELTRSLASQIGEPSWPKSPLRSGGTAEDLSKSFFQKILPGSKFDPQDASQTAHFPKPIGADLIKEYETQVALIRQVLDSNGVPLGDDAQNLEFLEEASDYFWVRYRETPQSSWQSVHPAFGAPLEEPVEIATAFSDSIPSDLQHRLRIEMFMERRLGEKSEVVALMKAWERPIANLVGLDLEFTAIELGSDNVTSEAEENILFPVPTFIPIFNGSPPEGAVLFDLLGNAIDSMALSSAATGVFQSISSAAGWAAGAIDGKEGDTPVQSLERVWIRYTLVNPATQERSFDRDILSQTEQAIWRKGSSRSDGQVRTATADITTHHRIRTSVGPYPVSYRLDRAMMELIESKEIIGAALGYMSGQKTSLSVESTLSTLRKLPYGLADLETIFDAGPPDLRTTLYRSGPALLVRALKVDSGKSFSSILDIVSNPHRAIIQTGKSTTLSSEGVLKAGVWATVVEGRALGFGIATQVSLEQIRKRSASANIEFVFAGPGNKDATSRLQLSRQATSGISSDVSNGYVVITPARTLKDIPGMMGWWRVHPSTGETLGILENGGGASMAEYVKTLKTAMSNAKKAAFFEEALIFLFVCLAAAWLGSSDCEWDTISVGEQGACLAGFVTVNFVGVVGPGIALITKWIHDIFAYLDEC